MTVIDKVQAYQVEDGDTIRYTYKNHKYILDVKGEPVDTGDRIKIYGYSHETGDNITVKFRPDQTVDIMGS